MKRFNYITIKAIFLALILFAGCKKDYLNRVPQDSFVSGNFYSTTALMRQATGALYCRPWWDFNYPFIFDEGDVQAGNAYSSGAPRVDYVKFALDNGDGGIKYGWSSCYNTVANANVAIYNITNNAASSITQSDKNAALAEAHFIRGTAYFNLVRCWGSVPIITNSFDLGLNPIVPRNLETDAYKFALNDLKFACKYLKTSDDKGRVTQWSAKGMVAKLYLTLAGKDLVDGVRNQADLDSAKLYAGDVCKNSGLSLLPNYYDLFLQANNNNPESLFALQWVAGKEWGSQNTWQAFLAQNGSIAGLGDGWNGADATWDLYQSFDASDLRRKATFMEVGDTYSELITTANPNGYIITSTTNNGANAGIKKYVIGGTLVSGNDPLTNSMQTGINTYILRLADVYLTYAEAILGNQASTNDGDALTYFNKVRTRAGLTAAISINADDILHERRCEFAFEGQYWFDILRLHDYNPTKAVNLLSTQNRASFTYNTTTNKQTPNDTLMYTPSATSWTMPYPAVDVVKNPKLNQDPVPYNFSN